MKSRILTGALAALAALPHPPVQGPQGGVEPAGGPPPALSIDGEAIPADDLARFLLERQGARLAREFAEGWVVSREAAALGVAVGDEDVQAELEREIAVRVRHAFRGEREEWLAELGRLERSETGHRLQRALELRPLLDATAVAAKDRVVPEEKIVRDWERIYGPRGRTFELHVLKLEVEQPPLPDGLPWPEQQAARQRVVEEVRRRALEVRERLVAGESFAALARELSDDPDSRAQDGRMVQGFRRPGWPHRFIEALFELEPDEISEPVFARGGWWLVRIESFEDTPLEEVRAELEARLLAQGPEQDEIGTVWNALTADMELEFLPGLFAPATTAEEGPVAALRIDGEEVPRAVFARWLLHTRGEGWVGAFAEAWLVEREARAQGVRAEPELVERRVREVLEERIQRGHEGSREAWVAYLNATGRDEELFLRELRHRMHTDALAEQLVLRERVVGEEEVRTRFRAEYGAEGRKVSARMLMVRPVQPQVEEGLSRDELTELFVAALEQARRRAEELAQRARSGEDFGTLARQHSDDPRTRELGGALEGGFQPGTWSEGIAEAVLALEPAAVSEPLLWGDAWFVFEVTGVETVSFEDVAARLERELRERRPTLAEIAGYRNTLRKQAEVRPLPGLNE